MTDSQRALIYILHWGDLLSTVRMLAAARMIREAHRRDRVVLLTTPDFQPFLKHCPFFNLIETDARPDNRQVQAQRDKRLKAIHPARIYDLRGDGESKKLRRLLMRKGTEWIEAVPDRKSTEHPIEAVAAKLGAAGLGPAEYTLGAAPPPDVSWVDFVARQSRMLDPEYFGLNGAFALLAPAGDGVKSALRWPKERWASLAHDLLEQGVAPAVVGGPDARETGRYVAHVAPGSRDLTGKAKLTQLAGLGRRCSFVFGEDTPLLHLLAASGAPALALYPETEQQPELIAPRGEKPVILMHAPTLAQIRPSEAISAMRFAGGFASAPPPMPAGEG